MRLTYINITKNGEYDYSDGFCCGSYRRNPTSEDLQHRFSDGWYDERDVWIGDKRDPKAKYVRKQWERIIEEIESGNIKPGMRIGWFQKDGERVAAEIEKFRSSMRKIGYDVDERIVERISLFVRFCKGV